MSTIYTLNGKVLKNSANDKWLIKAVPPQPSFDSVTIGSQTWMSKNLSIDDGQGGIYTQTVNYGQGDVTEYYYTWDAAVRVAATVDGWHLPTQSEWNTLVNTVGGRSTSGPKLRSTYGWNNDGNGTDNYGFSGLPSGYIFNTGVFKDLGNRTYFWTATATSETYANCRGLSSSSNLIIDINQDKTYRYSVRLIKDV